RSGQSGPTPLTATQLVLRDAAAIRRRLWLYGQHYIRGFVSFTIGRTKIGKSGLTYGEMLAMTTGIPVLGEPVEEPLRVWYIGEDPLDEIERRLVAACARHKISKDQIGDRLFVDSTRRMRNLRIARQVKGAVVIDHKALEALATEIRQKGIDVLILDTL